MSRPLAGLRVVEVASEIAGPYCGKLLVDLGADVVKIEPPSGDPLRRWGAHGGLFEYLNAGKRGSTIDLADNGNLAAVHDMIARADILVEDLPAGGPERLALGLDAAALARINPALVVVRITSFGQQGPLCDRVVTPLTLQAASGWVNMREPGRAPVQAGARIPEYVAGAYAALGALTAIANPIRGAESAGRGGRFSVRVPAVNAAVPDADGRRLKSLGLPTNAKAAPMLGIVHAADGWIGINCLTGQYWLDVCAMVGLPEFGEHQLAIMLGGPERDEFFAKAQPWLDSMTVDDIVELSQAMRIPGRAGHRRCHDPEYSAICRARIFHRIAVDKAREKFTRPGAPFRLSKTPVPPPCPAPRSERMLPLVERSRASPPAATGASIPSCRSQD